MRPRSCSAHTSIITFEFYNGAKGLHPCCICIMHSAHSLPYHCDGDDRVDDNVDDEEAWVVERKVNIDECVCLWLFLFVSLSNPNF